MLPRRATVSFGAPRARWTMYWSVHQYQSPMIGAQISMPGPRELVVEVPGLPDDGPRRVRLEDGQPRGLLARGGDRLPEVEHLGSAEVPQLGPTAEPVQPVEGQAGRAPDEHDHLDGVVVDHRPHAPEERVEAGQQDDRNGADPEAVDRGAAHREVHLGQQRREHDPPAKIPTAIFERMNVMMETIERT